MTISQLKLKNFGPYETADILFDKFTTILGPNGAGKSILFSALKAIGRVAKFPLRYGKQQPRSTGFPTRTGNVSFEDIVHNRDTARPIVLRVEFNSSTVSGHYEVHLKHWEGAAGIIREEHLSATLTSGKNITVDANVSGFAQSNTGFESRFRTPRFISVPVLLFGSDNNDEREIGREVQRALTDRVGVYRLDPTALKTPAEVGRTLSATGYNFANYLDQIRNDQGGRKEFDALMERFRTICPHVEDVLLPVEVEKRRASIGKGRFFEEESVRKHISIVMSHASKAIPAELESDGTILLLAYSALLHGPHAYETMCIEEPENGIHPKAVPRLVKLLQDLTNPRGEAPGPQILVCTHSKKFLDEVAGQPATIRLVRRGGGNDGRSTVETPPAASLPSLAGWAGLT